MTSFPAAALLCFHVSKINSKIIQHIEWIDTEPSIYFPFKNFPSHILFPPKSRQQQFPSAKKTPPTPALQSWIPFLNNWPVMFSGLVYVCHHQFLSDKCSLLDLEWKTMEEPYGTHSSGILIILFAQWYLNVLELTLPLAGVVCKDQEAHESCQWLGNLHLTTVAPKTSRHRDVWRYGTWGWPSPRRDSPAKVDGHYNPQNPNKQVLTPPLLPKTFLIRAVESLNGKSGHNYTASSKMTGLPFGIQHRLLTSTLTILEACWFDITKKHDP